MVPVNVAICWVVGPVSTNVRPCRPSVDQGTSDCGLPERRSEAGSLIPAAVPLSAAPKIESAAAPATRGRTPVTRKPSTTMTTTIAAATAVRGGMYRPSSRATQRTSALIARASPSRAAAITIVTTATRM